MNKPIDKPNKSTKDLSPLNSDLAFEFQWRARSGNLHNVSDMHTGHLFFTLRMIWNHAAPEHLKLLPYQKYAFNPAIYTPTYIKQAVQAIMRELDTRTNLPPKQKSELQFIYKAMQSFQEHQDTVQPLLRKIYYE